MRELLSESKFDVTKTVAERYRLE